tara:strand:- start:181 stop:426 length:246 start_codon:yes stop_codon:yes gene_type:complete
MSKTQNPKLMINKDKENITLSLFAKQKELKNLYNSSIVKLNEIENRRNQLNKEEESLQFELSGLHGALKVIDELIEEAKIQ